MGGGEHNTGPFLGSCLLDYHYLNTVTEVVTFSLLYC